MDLFVDAAEWPEEIDRERAESALGRAAKRLATETLAWRIEASRRAAARAHNRIGVPGESRPNRRRPFYERSFSRMRMHSGKASFAQAESSAYRGALSSA